MKFLSLLLLTQLVYVNPIEDPSQDPSLPDVYYTREATPKRQYVKVEIVLRDNLARHGGQLIEASFNNKKIALRPTDFLGNRGTFYFRIQPGNYEIKWAIRYPNRKINREEYRKTISIPDFTKKLIYIEIKEDNIYID